MAQPNNTNFLSPVGYRFEIKRLPKTNFFVQSVSLPSVSVGEVQSPTPFSNLQLPGDKLTFGELAVTFRVDEDLGNYKELYTWLRSITRVDNFGESTGWANEQTPWEENRVYSDATLMFLNSAMNPNVEVKFTDCYCSSLSDLVLNTQSQDIDYIECTATFKYRKFDFI